MGLPTGRPEFSLPKRHLFGNLYSSLSKIIPVRVAQLENDSRRKNINDIPDTVYLIYTFHDTIIIFP